MEDDTVTTTDDHRIELPPGPAAATKTALNSAERFDIAREINIAAGDRSVPIGDSSVLEAVKTFRDALAETEGESTLHDPNGEDKYLRWAREAVELIEGKLGPSQMPPREQDFHHGPPGENNAPGPNNILDEGNTVDIQVGGGPKITDAQVLERATVEWQPRYITGEKLAPEEYEFVRIRGTTSGGRSAEYTLHVQSSITIHSGWALNPEQLGECLGCVTEITLTEE